MVTGEEVTDCRIELADIEEDNWCADTTVDDISDGIPELLEDGPATADTVPHRKAKS